MGLNELKGRSATVRMRLVQSLILSDVVMGFSGLAGCGLFLSGHEFRPFTPACDGLGVIFAAVIFSRASRHSLARSLPFFPRTHTPQNISGRWRLRLPHS